MRKTDLNITVGEWCANVRQEYSMSVRLTNCLLHKGLEAITMRELCQMSVASVAEVENMGAKTCAELVHLLARHGLTLEMTRADIADYEGTEDSRPERPIDWERRRWDFVSQYYIHNDTSAHNAVRYAEEVIDEYIKAFGKEGKAL